MLVQEGSFPHFQNCRGSYYRVKWSLFLP